MSLCWWISKSVTDMELLRRLRIRFRQKIVTRVFKGKEVISKVNMHVKREGCTVC